VLRLSGRLKGIFCLLKNDGMLYFVKTQYESKMEIKEPNALKNAFG